MHTLNTILNSGALPGMLTILVGLLSGVAYHWIGLLRDQRLAAFLTAVVKAAEQTYGPGAGEQKLSYVQGIAGKTVNPLLIQAAVYDLKQGAAPVAAVLPLATPAVAVSVPASPPPQGAPPPAPLPAAPPTQAV